MVCFSNDGASNLPLITKGEATYSNDRFYFSSRTSFQCLRDDSNIPSEHCDSEPSIADCEELTGEPVSDSRRLLERWRSGDHDARQQLLTINFDLVERIAKTQARKHEANEEDLFDVALLALFDGIEGLYWCSHSNARAYIATVIKHAVIRELRAKWKYERRFKEADLADVPEPAAPDDNLLDIWDELEFCCESSLDLQIVRLRSARHTFAEISQRLGVKLSTVHFRLSKVEKRYNERERARLHGHSSRR